MWWKIIILMLMTAVIVAAFVTEPPQQQIGPASRIFYFHIPVAWVSVIAFTMSMIYSIRFLARRDLVEDDKAVEAARLGLIFCVLATISGSIFARVTWGSFWNWDPRETSIFVLLLIYGAYFALRRAVDVEEKRATLAAAYAILAFVTVPMLVFVVPRVMPSLHPGDSIADSNLQFMMSTRVGLILATALISFTAIYLWLFNVARRIRILERSLTEQEL
ncbi:MAG: cytochrome c biogenesis protein [bacterium]